MKMIKVVCIENKDFWGGLKTGEIYEAEFDIDGYWICMPMFVIDIDDAIVQSYKNKIHYPKKFFITLAEWREKQIDNILND